MFEVDVANGKVTGSAHYFADPDFHRVDGKASGDFNGEALRISVWWNENKSYGQYEGRIDSTGHLAGVTKDLQGDNNPEVYWSSKQTFKCAQAEPPPPASNAESVPKPPSGFNPSTPPALESVPKPLGNTSNFLNKMKP